MTHIEWGRRLIQIAKIGPIFAFNALKHKTIFAIFAGGGRLPWANPM